MHFQRLEELDEIERWRKMARIDAIFFYAYPTVIFCQNWFPDYMILQAFALFNLIYWPYWVLMPNAQEFLGPDSTAEDS